MYIHTILHTSGLREDISEEDPFEKEDNGFKLDLPLVVSNHLELYILSACLYT